MSHVQFSLPASQTVITLFATYKPPLATATFAKSIPKSGYSPFTALLMLYDMAALKALFPAPALFLNPTRITGRIALINFPINENLFRCVTCFRVLGFLMLEGRLLM